MIYYDEIKLNNYTLIKIGDKRAYTIYRNNIKKTKIGYLNLYPNSTITIFAMSQKFKNLDELRLRSQLKTYLGSL